MELAGRLDRRVAEFSHWTGRLPVPVTIREATAARGFRLGPHATPLSTEDERSVAEFRDWFKGWLPPVLDECRHV
jgi:hypothetical protein